MATMLLLLLMKNNFGPKPIKRRRASEEKKISLRLDPAVLDPTAHVLRVGRFRYISVLSKTRGDFRAFEFGRPRGKPWFGWVLWGNAHAMVLGIRSSFFETVF